MDSVFVNSWQNKISISLPPSSKVILLSLLTHSHKKRSSLKPHKEKSSASRFTRIINQLVNGRDKNGLNNV